MKKAFIFLPVFVMATQLIPMDNQRTEPDNRQVLVLIEPVDLNGPVVVNWEAAQAGNDSGENPQRVAAVVHLGDVTCPEGTKEVQRLLCTLLVNK